jgi:hypothetical protein
MDGHSFLSAWRRGGSGAPEPRPSVIPEVDDRPIGDSRGGEIECEGQSFMIEYLDSKNDMSCRSITVRSVKYNAKGNPYLSAHCHQRNAPRHFLLDRIECCIDFDGVVHETKPFLVETLGFDAELPRPVNSPRASRVNVARERARPHAILLACLSRCDGYMHPDEFAILCQHCEQLCDDLTLDECNELGTSYRRLRPTTEQMMEAIEMIRAETPIILEKFLVTAHQLIAADGKLTADEVRLFDEFSSELTGVGWIEPG